MECHVIDWKRHLVLPAMACIAMLISACGTYTPIDTYTKTPEDDPRGGRGPIPIPDPIGLLLPTDIRIHQFTQAGTLDEEGKHTGLDVQVEAFDGFDDACKAFGVFRFELYSFVPNSTDPKGGRLASWELVLTDPKINLAHWQPIDRRYRFKLDGAPMTTPTGKLVLTVTFTSDYTRQKFHQRVIDVRPPQSQ